MMAAPASVALGVLLIGCATLLFGLYAQARENPLLKRLGAAADRDAPVAPAADGLREGGVTGLRRALRRFLAVAGSWGESFAGTAQDRRQLRQVLNKAGFRAEESLGLLMLAKYGTGLVFVLVVLFGLLDAAKRFGPAGLAGGLTALFAGTFLPEAWLRWRAARRGGLLARSVPDGLDLMVICAEAGLPLGRIFQVVSKELTLAAPELADELRYTFAELQIGGDRPRALAHLSERCGVVEIETMVSVLLQAERYGTPLSQALRTISEESRKMAILTLEEAAGKLPARMSLPLMVLILPPIIALMGAPAMIRLIRVLSGP